MQGAAIVLPMLALVLFTFGVGMRLFFVRKAAIESGEVRVEHFRSFSEGSAPEKMAAAGRAFSNLAEVPPIFYAACLAILVLGLTDTTYLVLAWAYVALRVAQGLVHLTYNKVMHRAQAYFASWFVLLAIWVRVGLQAAQAG